MHVASVTNISKSAYLASMLLSLEVRRNIAWVEGFADLVVAHAPISALSPEPIDDIDGNAVTALARVHKARILEYLCGGDVIIPWSESVEILWDHLSFALPPSDSPVFLAILKHVFTKVRYLLLLPAQQYAELAVVHATIPAIGP